MCRRWAASLSASVAAAVRRRAGTGAAGELVAVWLLLRLPLALSAPFPFAPALAIPAAAPTALTWQRQGLQITQVHPGETNRGFQVFLVPPGRQRLRLLVEGYVGVRYSMAYTPFIINSLQHDATLDLQPGQEIRFPLP